jgi:rod shape determining protein RodA
MFKKNDLFARFRLFNPLMLMSMVCLIFIGILYIYSSCSVREDVDLQQLYLRHAWAAGLGLIVYFVVALINYKRILKWSWFIYAVVLILLILVPIIGDSQMGAKRWLFGIQPSEPAKLGVVMILAWVFSQRNVQRGAGLFFLTALLVAVPGFLILLQPDLGTAMVLVPTVFMMMFAANVAPKLLWGSTLAGLTMAGLIMGTVYYTETVPMTHERKESLISKTCLRDHQIKRLQVFMFPDKDLHGSGYNRRQSQIAVGSGGAWGKGYLKGEHYMLGYLPPSVSSNDFIFAVLAEEAGFAGTVIVLLLFLFMTWTGLWVAFRCRDDGGRILCVGVVTVMFSHIFINIAMTIGLMPITGLPLPFISYGRTFMLTMMVGLGLVQSVSMYGREEETRFS